MGFFSRLPDAMEAVRVIGAGTGGISRLSFNLWCHIWHKVLPPKVGFDRRSHSLLPHGGEQLSQESHSIQNQSKWEQLLPLGRTTHPGAIKPEVGHISAGSMFPYVPQSWLHRHLLRYTCRGPGVRGLGGGHRPSWLL